MPFKGEILARPHKEHVAAMQVGQLAYIHAQELIITRKAVFVDLLTAIILEEHFYDDMNDEHVSIKRLGEGTSEDDFEIDVSILDWFDYVMNGYSTYVRLMRKKFSFIVFKNAEVTVLMTKNKILIENEPALPAETLESLEAQLAIAIDESKFEMAAELRDRIGSLKNAQ
ncbi:MAG: UvrB/UvrC motif-containing protein [Patescibacteria group bacterium]